MLYTVSGQVVRAARGRSSRSGEARGWARKPLGHMSGAGASARKRKQEPLSIAELEQKIAKLRRQEAVVTRHLDRLGAQQHKRAAPPALAPSSPPAPALDPYDARLAELRDNQARRLRAFWSDVRKEVRKLLKMGLVNQWFGIPVRESAWGQDARNWATYTAKVAHPMDLSTIRDRLGETDAENRYASPEQVTEDVRRIVRNCEVFNVGDSGDPVRKVSRTLQATWERRWQPADSTGLAFRWQEIRECTKAEEQVRVSAAPPLAAGLPPCTLPRPRAGRCIAICRATAVLCSGRQAQRPYIWRDAYLPACMLALTRATRARPSGSTHGSAVRAAPCSTPSGPICVPVGNYGTSFKSAQ